MSTWSRKSTLTIGVAVILLSNAVALGGVAYNRSGEAESSLRLTERELRTAANWESNRENSGMALALRWRALAEDAGKGGAYSVECYAGYCGAPKWLERNKLAALGFDTSSRGTSTEHLPFVPAREVLLVLEFNGPSYQTALERARARAAQAEAARATYGDSKEVAEKARFAKEQLDREEQQSSRLFVVDAGVDPAVLRALYPDTARYAIVRGQVRPLWMTGSVSETPKLVGYVSGVNVDHINVPHALRLSSAFARLSVRSSAYSQIPPSEITIAFGRRLEPWITSAEKR